MVDIIIANMVLASTYVISKALLAYLPPFYLAGLRCMITGFLSFFINTKAQMQSIYSLSLKGRTYLLSVAFFGIFLVYFLEFWALQSVSATKVALLYNAFPFFTVIFSFFFFQERMGAKKWLGLFIGMAGIVPILMMPAPGEQNAISWLRISWQELALLAATMFESFSWVCSRILVREFQVRAFLLNGVSLMLGGCALLMIGVFIEPWHTITNPLKVFTLLFLLIVSAFISNNWITMLFKKFSLSLLSLAGLLLPVFTALLGYMFLGETISKETVISFLIIAFGMYVFYDQEVDQE